jgi:hypothetical protein
MDCAYRRESAVLVGIAIHSEVQEIGAYTAIIQQRVALARRAVTADALALVFGLDQKRQQFAFSAVDMIGERRVGRNIEESQFALLSLSALSAEDRQLHGPRLPDLNNRGHAGGPRPIEREQHVIARRADARIGRSLDGVIGPRMSGDGQRNPALVVVDVSSRAHSDHDEAGHAGIGGRHLDLGIVPGCARGRPQLPRDLAKSYADRG